MHCYVIQNWDKVPVEVHLDLDYANLRVENLNSLYWCDRDCLQEPRSDNEKDPFILYKVQLTQTFENNILDPKKVEELRKKLKRT